MVRLKLSVVTVEKDVPGDESDRPVTSGHLEQSTPGGTSGDRTSNCGCVRNIVYCICYNNYSNNTLS